MSDLIKRKQALMCAEHDSETYYALSCLPKVDAEPKWIPVSERLPDFGVDVLVTIESDNMRCIAVDYVYERYGEVWACYRNVTAWMELPNPYERKEE